MFCFALITMPVSVLWHNYARLGFFKNQNIAFYLFLYGSVFHIYNPHASAETAKCQILVVCPSNSVEGGEFLRPGRSYWCETCDSSQILQKIWVNFLLWGHPPHETNFMSIIVPLDQSMLWMRVQLACRWLSLFLSTWRHDIWFSGIVTPSAPTWSSGCLVKQRASKSILKDFLLL